MNYNEVEYNDESQTYRRIKERRREKRRKKKRIKRDIILFFVVCMIITAGALGVSSIADIIKSGGDKTINVSTVLANVSETINAKEDAKEEESKSEESAESKYPYKQDITVKYPAISGSYTTITDAEIRSPYIALLDVDNSEIIAGRDCNATIYPASMTKVMTLIVAVEHLESLEDTVTFDYEMLAPLVQDEASRAGFEAGETVTAKDLLYGLILPSGADAAVGLADLIAGSEDAFVELMNEKCVEMGLTGTHFTNTSGLHDTNHYTTLIEQAMIMEYAMKNEICAEILGTYQYTTQSTTEHPDGILLTSTMYSRMYGDEVEGVMIIGGKTGFTSEAKHTLVSCADKDGHLYIAVTAYADDKWHGIFDDFAIYGNYIN
ncbi:MAG: D-alanyl-D-alanine carboxypeptidase family protein [Eubacterium sp.]